MKQASMRQALSTPSRLDNPFATCWTRPGAIPFRFSGRCSIEMIKAKLGTQDGRGTIIGPHGSGKTTLLESLKPVLVAAGFDIHAILLRDAQRRLPRSFADQLGTCNSSSMIIVDGYEQLHLLARWRLCSQVRRRRAGLLVTSHCSTRIPELITLSPDRDLVEDLVGALCEKVSTPVTADDIAASHACHGSNVREIFFDLYDRHEQRRRGSHSVPTPSQRLTRPRS